MYCIHLKKVIEFILELSSNCNCDCDLNFLEQLIVMQAN